MRRIFILAMAALVSSCISAGAYRESSYGQRLVDAKVRVGRVEISVRYHRTERTLLLMRNGLNQMRAPMPLYRAAAQRALDEVGCRVTEIYALQELSYEAAYACPDGRLVTREEVARHRDRWRAWLDAPDPFGG